MTPQRPLLLFPTHQTASRTRRKRAPFSVTTQLPSYADQKKRLGPMFRRLHEQFENRRAELVTTAAGADPDQVLVIETIGSTKDFASAVGRVPGLEWMGEFALDEIAPDAYFFDSEDKTKSLDGRVYLVMTDQRALEDLLKFWRQYQQSEKTELGYGLNKFKSVFATLRDIRRWGVQDRLYETGLLDAWHVDLKQEGMRILRFEIQLWYRKTIDKQREAREEMHRLIRQAGGRTLQESVIPEIAYHALLAEIPASAAERIILHPDTDLVKCDDVMFFRPVGQMAPGKPGPEATLLDHKKDVGALPQGDPVVAILDGLPLENHYLLENRLIIDDPDDCASDYTVQDRCHGTAMASLLIHGDLNDGSRPLPNPVYHRPIMRAYPGLDSRRDERIPDDVLVVDYIHRAVLRMFEGSTATRAVASTVRIINFSIGDRSWQYTQIMSPLARLLDWLSAKYHVLFVVSAGNHPENIKTGIPAKEFDRLSPQEKEAQVVRALCNDARNRRILSPSESINSIAVGALHHDTSGDVTQPGAENLFQNVLPSPVSPFGTGHRGAIKPDLLFDGGRVLYVEQFATANGKTFESRGNVRVPPGHKVASPGDLPAQLNKVTYCRGTSNAAALVSRMGAECHDTLANIFQEQAPDLDYHPYLAPLLKALLVHTCSWGTTGEHLRRILKASHNTMQVKGWISRWLGYGVPDAARALSCTEQRATLIGFGSLFDDDAHLFLLPLPPSLDSCREQRRLTVTLAWLSPIAAKTQLYRVANLWFEVQGIGLARKRADADWNDVRRGTVHHEIFTGDEVVRIDEDTNLTIKVNCRRDAAGFREPIPYGLIVSLEVAEGINIAIYDEIRTRITPAIKIGTAVT